MHFGKIHQRKTPTPAHLLAMPMQKNGPIRKRSAEYYDFYYNRT